MGSNDNIYIYGDSNGQSYYDTVADDLGVPRPDEKVHWDPRVEVTSHSRVVQIGVVPPSREHSTNASGVWDREDGQFLSLDRDGVNRLIRALREAREAVFGRDE
jgi:hypothetical protein